MFAQLFSFFLLNTLAAPLRKGSCCSDRSDYFDHIVHSDNTFPPAENNASFLSHIIYPRSNKLFFDNVTLVLGILLIFAVRKTIVAVYRPSFVN